jgi:hypothetical protein
MLIEQKNRKNKCFFCFRVFRKLFLLLFIVGPYEYYILIHFVVERNEISQSS